METTRMDYRANGRSAPPETTPVSPDPIERVGQTPEGRSLGLLPTTPLNSREQISWWGPNMPPKARFAPEILAQVGRLEEMLKSHPLRALRLTMRFNAAVQAAVSVEEDADAVLSQLEVRRRLATEPIQELDARIRKRLDYRDELQKELEGAEDDFAAVAGKARLLLADPLQPSPEQVAEALDRMLPCGAEVAGQHAMVPAEREGDLSSWERRKTAFFEMLAPVFLGFLLGILILTVCIGFKLSEMQTPSLWLGLKLLVGQGLGMCTEYGLRSLAANVAGLLAMHRDGLAGKGHPDSRRDGIVIWAQVIVLIVLFICLSVFEGIGLHDLHAQASRLLFTQDGMPFVAYCLFGGVPSGIYLSWQFSSAFHRQTNRRRDGVEAFARRQERKSWLEAADAEEVIRLAHRVPLLRQRLTTVDAEVVALEAARKTLAYPSADEATLTALGVHGENALGARMEAMGDLHELIEALEPLQKSK